MSKVLGYMQDEELLIELHFSQIVRVAHIGITGPEDKGPSKVKLFVNKLSMDFDNAKSEKDQVL